jgi:hypothetical protein
MKKLLLLILIVASTIGHAQTVAINYDAVNNSHFVNIQPIVPNPYVHPTDTATRLTVISINDNLINSCQFVFKFEKSDGTSIGGGSFTMKGIDYTNWDASVEQAILFVIHLLPNVTLK